MPAGKGQDLTLRTLLLNRKPTGKGQDLALKPLSIREGLGTQPANSTGLKRRSFPTRSSELIRRQAPTGNHVSGRLTRLWNRVTAPKIGKLTFSLSLKRWAATISAIHCAKPPLIFSFLASTKVTTGR